MAKASQMARLEALEQRQSEGEGIVLIGGYEIGRDGGITAYARPDFETPGYPERVIEVVPKARARNWLASLIKIERSYGGKP
jgi:hypothetical protein